MTALNWIKSNDGKRYVLPNNPTWNKGRPPDIGWWPASVSQQSTVLRYWNGEHWSRPCHPRSNESTVEDVTKTTTFFDNIEWSERWWLNQPEGYPKITK
jgi:hypothetical protein